jgi:DNA-binding FadR family transcriptional regulator
MSAALLIRGRSLVDRVVQVIGLDIATGHFPPGGQLPNEAEWCERLDVSRSVLREALPARAVGCETPPNGTCSTPIS